MILKPRPYQLQAIEAVVQAWKEGTLRPAVVLPTGAGKGHPLDTEVPTPKVCVGGGTWLKVIRCSVAMGSQPRSPRSTIVVYRTFIVSPSRTARLSRPMVTTFGKSET